MNIRSVLWRGLKLAAALSVTGLVLGVVYQQFGLARDAERFPMPGTLYSLPDRELHLHCEGEGAPVVLFESGAAGFSGLFDPVFAAISQTTRACFYDRSGMGWSPYVEGALSTDAVAENLHMLLEAAGITEDRIVVGHSMGGVYLRRFVDLHPEGVKGAVFVDSAHEQMGLHMARTEAEHGFEPYVNFEPLIRLTRLLNPLARLGAIRLAIRMVEQPNESAQRIAAMYAQSHTPKAISIEIDMWYRGIFEKTGPVSMGDLPITVLMRGVYEDSPTQAQNDAWRDFWRVLQQDIADLSSRSELIVAQESDHLTILTTQADLVIDAISRHVSAARQPPIAGPSPAAGTDAPPAP